MRSSVLMIIPMLLTTPLLPSVTSGTCNYNPIGSVDIHDVIGGYFAVSGSYAYEVADVAGFLVIDVTDPSAPLMVASVAFPDYIRAGAVAVSGSLAYVVLQGAPSRLQVIDIATPTSPVLLGHLDFVGASGNIAISGSYAYVCASTAGIMVFDISDSMSPQIVNTVNTPGHASEVEIAGNYAYVADFDAGLQVIDITNPLSAYIVGSVDTPDFSRGVTISGSYAYLVSTGQFFGSPGGLYVVDVSNLASPNIVGHITLPVGASAVTTAGTYAYVADLTSSVQVVDITLSTSPQIAFSSSTPVADGILHANSYIYVKGRSGPESVPGLFIFPLQCTECTATVDAGGPYETCGNGCVALDGEVSDASLIVAWTSSGSGIFAPNNKTVDALYCPSAADIAEGSITLTLTAESCPGADASLAISPAVPVAAMEVEPNTINTQSGGNYITGYLEFPPEYDPAQVLLESVRLNGVVTVSSDFLDIGDWNHNHVPDLTLKFSRVAVEAALQEGDQVPISITGTIAGQCFAGTDMIRVIRPHLNHPNGGESYVAGMRTLLEWENPQGWTVDHAQIHYSADGGDTWTLVADHVTSQSYVWAVPQEPTQDGRVRVMLFDDQGVMGYDASDGPFSVSAATTGLPETIPTRHRLYQNSPNPFRGATRVAFDLPEEGKVTLKVFDLNGRVVRVLADDWYPAGKHELPWNALDAGGKSVSAGIYFLHIATGSFTDTKRMYLSK